MSQKQPPMFNNQLHTLHIWRYDRLIEEFNNTFASGIDNKQRVISKSQYLEESDKLDKLRDDFKAIRWRLQYKPYYVYANDEKYRTAKAAYEAQRFLVILLDTILTHPMHRRTNNKSYQVENFIEAVAAWSEEEETETHNLSRQLSVSDQLREVA